VARSEQEATGVPRTVPHALRIRAQGVPPAGHAFFDRVLLRIPCVGNNTGSPYLLLSKRNTGVSADFLPTGVSPIRYQG
jgi:hypothetical protein